LNSHEAEAKPQSPSPTTTTAVDPIVEEQPPKEVEMQTTGQDIQEEKTHSEDG